MHARQILVSLAVLALVPILGCSDATEPAGAGLGDGTGEFEGTVDPTADSVVLKSLDIPDPDGVPVRVEILGRFVRPPTAPDQVVIAVRVRNADHRALYAPAELVLGNFQPRNVHPAGDNPDWVRCPTDSSLDLSIPGPECRYGYDFSALLGEDRVLLPGEISGERLWIFQNPDGVSFSFAVAARFALADGGAARIAGLFYHDANRNGHPDPDESPFGGGWVQVTGPGIEERQVQVDENGRYEIGVREPGLYSLFGIAPPTFAPVEFTVPNPLEVVVIQSPDGQLQSFLHADFGVVNALEPPPPPVLFVDIPDSLTLDFYHLLEVRLDRTTLRLRVGISGCSPDHPLQLYMVGGFMESNPPQVRLLLAHDDRDELCDAYFERALAFDLRPILGLTRNKDDTPVPVILLFENWQGEITRLELYP